MQTTTICTNDKELNIIHGGYKFMASQTPRDVALTSVKYLYTDLTDIRKYYIKLGFHLDEFARNEYYKDFGFITLEDFCDKNLGLDKSAVSRCINVFRAFNAGHDVTYNNGVESHGGFMNLSERYKDFSYTQRCEMLPLSDDQRKEIKPDMTIKQIREYKKRLKSSPDPFSVIDKLIASTQLFDYEKFVTLHGAAEQSYIKKCDADSSRVLYVFDSNGKCLYGNKWVDVLLCSKDKVVIRLYDSPDLDDNSGNGDDVSVLE
jgi:hypothetical protein